MVAEMTHPISADHARAESGFLDHIALLSNRIDYRIADSDARREAIFRLRYQAYVRDGTIRPSAPGMFSDRYDELGNVYLFGLYIDDVLGSSVRLHVPSRERPHSPSLEVFSDFLQPELNAGKVTIDATCFVADANLARLHRGLPYATFRLCMLAARYFSADQVLTSVGAEHQAFYRRAFNYRLIGEPRAYPLLAKPLGLMGVHYPSEADQLIQRYPFFRSSLFERRMLFERPNVSLQPEASGFLVETTPSIELNAAGAASY
jgi:N-acyl-L-homoserine lactone synthetase